VEAVSGQVEALMDGGVTAIRDHDVSTHA